MDKINLTPAELSNQLKNIDAQKLLDSASPIRYNFQQTPIPKIENPMVKEQQKSNNKLDAIQYENMKLRIKNERLKKGYIVEGDGQVVIFNGSKNKNSK